MEPNEQRQQVEQQVDLLIEQLVNSYTGGSPVGVVVDVLLARVSQIMDSQQYHDTLQILARFTNDVIVAYEQQGFSREEAVSLITSALSRRGQK